MKQNNLTWISASGKNLFGSKWEPNSEIRGVICLVHGFGEHCMRYQPYLKPIVESGFAVVAYDQIGHGKSEGKRGVISSYNQLLDDVKLCIDKADELYPNVPRFIYGHSMGGNIVFNYILKRQNNFAGAIITSPWLTLTKNPNVVAQSFVSLMQKIVPNIAVESGLEQKYISTVNKEVEAYKEDGLNHGKISFKLLNNIMKNGVWAINNVKQLNVKTLLMHGSNDKITSPASSKQAYENNPELIEYREWPGCYHELHNETIRLELSETVIEWLNKQLN